VDTTWAKQQLTHFLQLTQLSYPPPSPGVLDLSGRKVTAASSDEIIPAAQVVEQILDRALGDWRSAKPGSTETSLRPALSSQVGSLWQSPGAASRRCTTSAVEMVLLRGQRAAWTVTLQRLRWRSIGQMTAVRPQTERRPQCAHPPTGRLLPAVI
jgi:hypothetical protein